MIFSTEPTLINEEAEFEFCIDEQIATDRALRLSLLRPWISVKEPKPLCCVACGGKGLLYGAHYCPVCKGSGLA